MAREIKLRLQGGLASLGDVPASDVAKLIIAAERAVADAATQIVGRRPGLTGRKGGAVEQATRLRLVAVRSGSVMPVLALPEPETHGTAIGLDDATLGPLALDATLSALLGDDSDPVIARALVQLADEVGIGSRYDRLTVEDYSGTHKRREAVLDRAQRDRLHRSTQRRPKQSETVTGTVFEADFERRSAKVRTPRGRVVSLQFPAEMADTIQEVLRHQTRLQGSVEYDPLSGEASSIEVRQVTQTDQLLLHVFDEESYWNHRQAREVVDERGGVTMSRSRDLVDDDLDSEEVDAFLVEIGEG